jgi:hypothetical protein
MPTIPQIATVTFSSNKPSMRVVAILDEQTARVTEGYGGWTEQSRARRKSATLWTGKPVLKMTLPIVFDGFINNRPVDNEIATLEKMATIRPQLGQPPVVRVHGAVPHDDLPWVINAIDWGETIRSRNGSTLRQHFVVTLWEYVVEDVLFNDSPAARRIIKSANKPTGKHRNPQSYSRTTYGYKPTTDVPAVASTIYVAKKGETLSSIAADKLGNFRRWKEITVINENIYDPNHKFKGGEKMRMPVP